LGLTGIAAQITQGWRGANPGLCYTTPLGLELPAAFQPILSLMDKDGFRVASQSSLNRVQPVQTPQKEPAQPPWPIMTKYQQL
jgi:hypothetical protein